jgi:hypothetical protein
MMCDQEVHAHHSWPKPKVASRYTGLCRCYFSANRYLSTELRFLTRLIIVEAARRTPRLTKGYRNDITFHTASEEGRKIASGGDFCAQAHAQAQQSRSHQPSSLYLDPFTSIPYRHFVHHRTPFFTSAPTRLDGKPFQSTPSLPKPSIFPPSLSPSPSPRQGAG